MKSQSTQSVQFVNAVIKALLDKKEHNVLNFAVSHLGMKNKVEEELNNSRFKVFTPQFFQEKPDPAHGIAAGLTPAAFKRLSGVDYNKHFSETFKNIYKRNSANISRVTDFYNFMGRKFFSRLTKDQLIDALNPKIIEGLGNRADEIAIMGLEALQFFAGLNNEALNDYIAANAFTAISQRNVENVKLMGLRICFAMKTKSPETSKAIYALLNNCLEGIKSDEIKTKVATQFYANSLGFARRFGSLGGIDALLETKGSELNTSMRNILAKHIIEEKLKQGEAIPAALEGALNTTYGDFVKRSLIDNANRLQATNFETLSAVYLIVAFNKKTGKMENEVKAIAEALSNRELEYYSENFFINCGPENKGVLFETLIMLENRLEYPQKYFDAVIGRLLADGGFDPHPILRKHKPTAQFILAGLRGVKVLQEWRHMKVDMEHFWYLGLDVIFQESTLERDEAFLVLDSLAQQKPKSHLVKRFISTMATQNKTDMFKPVLTYPLDMKDPIDHHYLGTHGLFSLFLDKQTYYHQYVAMLIAIDLGIFFDRCKIFYQTADLHDVKLVHSRNLMVKDRDLEMVYSPFKEPYRETLEAIGYIKKENKPKGGGGKKKAEEPAIEVRAANANFRVASDLEMKVINRDSVYDIYSFILRRLSDCTAEAFGDIFDKDSARGIELMDKIRDSGLFEKLKTIAKEQQTLRESIKKLLCVILNGLISKVAPPEFCHKFTHLYFEVISTERAVQLNRVMEESLNFLFKVRDEKALHKAAVPILSDFSRFCFENMYAADDRRRAFDIIISMDQLDTTGYMHKFILEHMDDLYFEDTKTQLNRQIDVLGKTNPNILSGFLLKILEFQDKAQRMFLEAVLDLSAESLATQTIGNFEKIKLIIITKGESKNNAALAQKVLDKIGSKLGYQQIIELDFLRMVKEIPFDLHIVTGKILGEAISHLGKEEKAGFFKKLVDNCTKQVNEYNNKVKLAEENPNEQKYVVDVVQIEELLGIYPVILSCLSPYCDESSLEEIFDMIINLESNYMPSLTERFCNTGISFISEHSKIAKKLLPVFEARIKQREGIITPLVFLGAAAKFVQKGEIRLDIIGDKILGLTESTDPVFQVKLGRYISRLLIFFDNPKEVVETLLKRVTEEKDVLKVRAKCYSIAGIIRGQGISYVDTYDIIGKINIIVKFLLTLDQRF